MTTKSRFTVFLLFLVIGANSVFIPTEVRDIPDADFGLDAVSITPINVNDNSNSGTDFQFDIEIDITTTISGHSLEILNPSTDLGSINGGTLTDTFSTATNYNTDPFNIQTGAGSDVTAQSFDLKVMLSADVLSVSQASYEVFLDDTGQTNTASNGKIGPLSGTARNHVNRVFSFSLNEGEIIRVAKVATQAFQDKDGNALPPSLKWYSGNITTTAGLSGEIKSWTEDLSPQIAITATGTYTLSIETGGTPATAGTFTSFKLEIGSQCGNRQRNVGEECDNGGLPGCRLCKFEIGYDCNSVALLEQTYCEPVCGNSIRTEDEQCDTGGDTDGCVGCKQVPGYDCNGAVGSSSTCQLIPGCGNNKVEDDEQCDNANGHGCSSDCVPDQGFECTGSPSVCQNCGNAVVEGTEPCDNGGKEGCSTGCTTDFGYVCTGSPSECEYVSVCNNGILEKGQNCDNGPSDEPDGCDDNCNEERGFNCSNEENETSSCQPLYACGNERYEPYNKNPREYCDNGDAPGCTDECKLEPGWRCINVQDFTSVCAYVCGNGIRQVVFGEQCDDDNIQNGDGCSDICEVEQGWECNGNAPCRFIGDLPPCGNGVLQTQLGEECDDNNNVDGDGCSSTCINETNVCGDGKLYSLYEQCDDGNMNDQDGCNNDCTQTQGYYCYINDEGEQSVCYCYVSDCNDDDNGNGENIYRSPLCGDGYLQLEYNEQCDDGWPPVSGDGCSSRCQLEQGSTCYNYLEFSGLGFGFRTYCPPRA